MRSDPPVLTPERIDAMISSVAEVCFESVHEAGDRLKTAPDMADFERAGRTLQVACRNLSQAIVLHQRLERERAGLAADRRREAEVERKEAERSHEIAVGRHRIRVRSHFERALWNAFDHDDAQDIFDEVDERLSELAADGGFLETPVETLIARLHEECVPPPGEDAADDEGVEPEDPAGEAEVPDEPVAALPPPQAEAAPEAAPPPEPDPPPRPPDPEPVWPEPYIPPWEKPRARGARPPSSGWLGS